MGVKKHVFGSNPERDHFYKLSRRWGDKYHIYHNLPFLNVFDMTNLIDRPQSQLQPVLINELDLSRLKKTSIDFTLCNENDEPQLCIEFDGLQQGFNVGPKYYPNSDPQSLNPWRQQITELKLRVATLSHFPFFIVASTHFAKLSPTTELTIVDGIIGEVLAAKTFHHRFQTEDMLGD